MLKVWDHFTQPNNVQFSRSYNFSAELRTSSYSTKPSSRVSPDAKTNYRFRCCNLFVVPSTTLLLVTFGSRFSKVLFLVCAWSTNRGAGAFPSSQTRRFVLPCPGSYPAATKFTYTKTDNGFTVIWLILVDCSQAVVRIMASFNFLLRYDFFAYLQYFFHRCPLNYCWTNILVRYYCLRPSSFSLLSMTKVHILPVITFFSFWTPGVL